ncbi:MAG: nicotinate (nicotinamide) nucleotide adenylyltransferase [Phycisphaerales bacterium]|nr:nicotinate (nicotinamide) nucleotide adenylyltransferase [Phycisphaerales bacterium]
MPFIMKIGLFFGSFNPIHMGHLMIGNAVANEHIVDQIWWVISPQNPHKNNTTLLDGAQRYYLVQKAIEDDHRFKASNIEFNLPKPSYTIDTLTYLKEQYPTHTFYPIIGSDSLSNINKWKNASLLKSNYQFIVYERYGFSIDPHTTNAMNYTLVTAPYLDISATYIRSIIKKGGTIKYLVPEIVREEIEKGGYYR